MFFFLPGASNDKARSLFPFPRPFHSHPPALEQGFLKKKRPSFLIFKRRKSASSSCPRLSSSNLFSSLVLFSCLECHGPSVVVFDFFCWVVL